MSDINFNCPHCQNDLAVDEKGAGRTVNCPLCQKPLVIPSALALNPPPVAPPSLPEQVKAPKAEMPSNSFQLMLQEALRRLKDPQHFQRRMQDLKQQLSAGPAGHAWGRSCGARNDESAPANSGQVRVEYSTTSGAAAPSKEHQVGFGAIAGSIILAISMPLKWEIYYAGGQSISTTGWIILLDAVGLFIFATAQRMSTTFKEAIKLSKPVMGCAGFAFLYACYTILTNWSIGEQYFAGMTSGAKNGPGVWLGLVGGIVALLSQIRFVPSPQKRLLNQGSNIEP